MLGGGGFVSAKSSDKILNKHKNKAPERNAKMPKMDKPLMNVAEAGSSKMAIAEGNRREKEKHAFIELSALLPLTPPIRDQLDKTGTLRVSISFLKLQRLFGTLAVANSNSSNLEKSVICGPTTSKVDDAFEQTAQNAAGFYGLGTSKSCFDSASGKPELMHQFAYNLFQAMDGFVIVLDGEGKVVYTSETVAVHLGLAQVELAGIALADFLHPDDAPLLRDLLALHLPARAFRVLQPELRFTLRFRCTPGRRAMMGCNGMGMQPGFKPIHFMGTLHADDDGRFMGYGQPSVAYGLNELRLCASMFMFRATPALQLIFVDNCFTELTKFMPDSLLNQSLYSFIHPADVSQLCEVQQTALRGGQALSAFFRLLNAEGGWHWVQCRLCTTITSRLPSLTQIVVGVCSIVRINR
ncbi:hypothetical protein GPALN_013279 [Globodera pallida]|nr:hypothetical protein GPALN_013279 [Globodera pallida]